VVRARRVEGGALNGWHDVDAVEAVVSRANMGGRRGGGSGAVGRVAGWPLCATYRSAALGSAQ
jgi:hypothetical protein